MIDDDYDILVLYHRKDGTTDVYQTTKEKNQFILKGI